MDALHPTIRAMMASAPRGRLELSGIGRWSRSLRKATGADAVLLVLPAEHRSGWTVLFECEPDQDFSGEWLGALRSLGVDLDLPLTARRLTPGDDLLRAARPEFAHTLARERSAIVVPITVKGGRGGWAVAAGAESRHQRRFEAAVSAVGNDIASALAHQEAREDTLRSLMRALPVPAFIVGADREVRISSAAAGDLFGFSEGRTSLGAIQESTGLAFAALVEAASVGGTRVSSEFEASRGPLRIDAAGLPDPEVRDVPGPVLVTAANLSERRRVARQQNEFLSTVGHELRTPLTSLRTSLELLATTGDLDADERSRMTSMALRNCERLDRLIGELLDTAQQRMGRILLEREQITLAGALAATVEDVSHTAVRTGRSVDVELDPASRAWVDPVRIVEIVEALFANALKFTPQGGRIEVRLRSQVETPSPAARELLDAVNLPSTGCLLVVEDDGVGMDDTTRSRAFEPFYQDGDPLGDRPTGAGLGLAIVRALTEAHAGQVRLESAPGEGTRISVWLPADEPAATMLGQLNGFEAAAVKAQRDGNGVALELVSSGTEPTAEEVGAMDLPAGIRARLLRVPPEWGATTAFQRRVGNDGESIGTSLARLLEECAAAIDS
jgi:signal transduction histidine kinase